MKSCVYLDVVCNLDERAAQKKIDKNAEREKFLNRKIVFKNFWLLLQIEISGIFSSLGQRMKVQKIDRKMVNNFINKQIKNHSKRGGT